MTNPAETDEKKKIPGAMAFIIGSALAFFGLLMIFMQIGGAASFTLFPWLSLVVGFGVLILGYLQKIAANK